MGKISSFLISKINQHVSCFLTKIMTTYRDRGLPIFHEITWRISRNGEIFRCKAGRAGIYGDLSVQKIGALEWSWKPEFAVSLMPINPYRAVAGIPAMCTCSKQLQWGEHLPNAGKCSQLQASAMSFSLLCPSHSSLDNCSHHVACATQVVSFIRRRDPFVFISGEIASARWCGKGELQYSRTRQPFVPSPSAVALQSLCWFKGTRVL